MKKDESFEEKVSSLIFLIGRNMKKKYEKDFEAGSIEHLSFAQLETLKFIGEQENPLMKDIANHLSIAAPSLTLIVDDLEKKKLIKRDSSKNDRRAIMVFLTKFGRNILDRILKIKSENMQYMVNKLTKEEQKMLIKILDKLSNLE